MAGLGEGKRKRESGEQKVGAVGGQRRADRLALLNNKILLESEDGSTEMVGPGEGGRRRELGEQEVGGRWRAKGGLLFLHS